MNKRRAIPTLDDEAGAELFERLRCMRHDLRTSIGIIQNTLHLLRRETGEDVSDKARRYIEVLVRQAGKMEELVEDSTKVAAAS